MKKEKMTISAFVCSLAALLLLGMLGCEGDGKKENKDDGTNPSGEANDSDGDSGSFDKDAFINDMEKFKDNLQDLQNKLDKIQTKF